MVKTELVLNKQLDAKDTAKFVQTASNFSSNVRLTSKEVTVDAKSIMGVMMLILRPGSNITIVAEGNDEKEAVAALEKTLI